MNMWYVDGGVEEGDEYFICDFQFKFFYKYFYKYSMKVSINFYNIIFL